MGRRYMTDGPPSMNVWAAIAGVKTRYAMRGPLYCYHAGRRGGRCRNLGVRQQFSRCEVRHGFM